MPDDNELLDIAKAAAFLHVSETSLRRWTNSGKLACLRIGQKRERRFRRADLLAFMEVQPGGVSAVGEHGKLATRRRAQSPALAGTLAKHSCGLYSTDDGRIKLAVPFLLDGLREGSVCFLVAAPRAREEILEHMAKRRPSVRAEIESGQLVLSNYHRSPQEQWRYFEAAISEAARNGAGSLRIFGDVWEMQKKTSPAAVVEYEAGYDQLIAGQYLAATLCAYDARRFDGIDVLNALKGHPDTLRYPLEEALA